MHRICEEVSKTKTVVAETKHALPREPDEQSV